MTREEALDKVFHSKLVVRKLVQRLLSWNESLTVRENAKHLGLTDSAASMFCGRYSLKYRRSILSGYKRYNEDRSKSTAKKYRKLWNVNLTVRENAKKIGVSFTTMLYMKTRYNLPDTLMRRGNRKSSATIEMRKQFKELRSRGFTMERIAQMYGLSRQRVHQILA